MNMNYENEYELHDLLQYEWKDGGPVMLKGVPVEAICELDGDGADEENGKGVRGLRLLPIPVMPVSNSEGKEEVEGRDEEC